MLIALSDVIGVVRRCVGDAVVPATAEIELVAAKIWQDCTPAGASVAMWPEECRDQAYYRCAARTALQGRSHEAGT